MWSGSVISGISVERISRIHADDPVYLANDCADMEAAVEMTPPPSEMREHIGSRATRRQRSGSRPGR